MSGELTYDKALEIVLRAARRAEGDAEVLGAIELISRVAERQLTFEVRVHLSAIDTRSPTVIGANLAEAIDHGMFECETFTVRHRRP